MALSGKRIAALVGGVLLCGALVWLTRQSSGPASVPRETKSSAVTPTPSAEGFAGEKNSVVVEPPLGQLPKMGDVIPVDARVGAHPEVEFDDLSCDLDPGAVTATKVLDASDAIVRAKLAELGVSQQDQLAAVFNERLFNLLQPEFQAWQEMVKNEQGTCPIGDTEKERAAFKGHWEVFSRICDRAPLDSRSIIVRKGLAGDRPVIGKPHTIFMKSGGRNSGGLEYPAPPEEAERVEFVVGCHIRDGAGEGGIPTKLVFRFFLDPSTGRWRPSKLFMYLGAGGFGRKLAPPAY